jgi:hypothetical protein
MTDDARPKPIHPEEWDGRSPLLALTVVQPWASAIACGIKVIETRGWRTSHRGPLVIHAGLGQKAETMFGTGRLFPPDGVSTLARAGLPDDRPLGAIVAITRLIDCRQAKTAPTELEDLLGDFGVGRWGWQLYGTWPLPRPIYTRGRLGLWEVTQPVLGDLLHQWHDANGL